MTKCEYAVASRFVCELDERMSFNAFLDALEEGDVYLWEPIENIDLSELRTIIWYMAEDIKALIKKGDLT